MRWLIFVLLAGCGSNQALSIWVHPRETELRPTVWYVETNLTNSTFGMLSRGRYVCGDDPSRFHLIQACGIGPITLSGEVWRLHDTSLCGTTPFFMTQEARWHGAVHVATIPEQILLANEAEIGACEDGLLSFHVALPTTTNALATLH